MHNHKKKSKIRFFGLIIVLGLVWYLSRYLRIDTQAIQNSLSKFPLVYSGLLYAVLYVIITFFIFFSKDVFWLVGAILFGPYISAFLVWVAEMINAFVLFYLARHLGRAFVEHHASEKYKEFDEKLGSLNFLWLFIFRAAPLIPYRFMDLGAGLTPIKFRKYFAAVVLGSPLKIFWIQYILAGVGMSIFSSPTALAEYFLSNRTLLAFSLVYPILVVFVVVKLIPRD